MEIFQKKVYIRICFSVRREMRENSRLYGRSTLFIPEILPEFFGVPFQCIILNPNGNDVGQVWLSQGNDFTMGING